MAGHVINEYLSLKDNYIINCIEENEVFDENLIFNKNMVLSDSDYIINCIRCLVEESELNQTKAILYNSYFPNLLYDYYKNSQTKIIHLSTDCVFSGGKGNYNEDSIHDGFGNYAKTKSLGEINSDKDIIIRTSYIGPTLEGNNEELFDWFLLQDGEIDGYCNAYWNGITTLELAKGIFRLIELDFSGIYHLVGAKKISKFSLLSLIKEIWQRENIKIKKSYTKRIDRSLIDNQKLISVKNYNLMFSELYQYMTKKKLKYKKYNLNS